METIKNQRVRPRRRHGQLHRTATTDAGVKYTKSSRSKVEYVAQRLDQVYGSPRLGNPTDPVDDLIFILLSGRTAPSSCAATFHALKKHYQSWEALTERGNDAMLRQLLEQGGLSRRRATYIVSLLDRLVTDFGRATLEPLRHWADPDAEKYLVGLPGIGQKSAKCVMLYTLGRQVFPVDAHTRRILGRLGLLNPAVRLEYAQDPVERLVPHDRRYSLHVNLVAHGRARCTSLRPKCGECAIRSACTFANQSAAEGSASRSARRGSPG